MSRLLALFFLTAVSCNLYAQELKDHYSLRAAWGYASEKDLGQILLYSNYSSHTLDLTTIAVDGGYLLAKNFYEYPVDVYIKGGVSYFNEDEFKDKYELLAYIKFFYNFDFLGNRVRFGFGEGVSLVNDNLESEVKESIAEGESYSKFLNYLDITLDFDIGKLFGYQPLEGLYFGYLLKHRSGVFGLYNGVNGGSNYNSFYLEKIF